MNVRRGILLLLVIGILGALAYRFADSVATGTNHFVPREVLKVGNQFSNEVAGLVAPFDELIAQADRQIELRADAVERSNLLAGVLGWIATILTALIAIIGAIVGIRPNALPNPTTANQPHKNVIFAMVLLAAISSGLQIVDDKLQKGAAQDKDVAQKLYEATQTSRMQFVNSGTQVQKAQEATSLLKKALLDDRLTP